MIVFRERTRDTMHPLIESGVGRCWCHSLTDKERARVFIAVIYALAYPFYHFSPHCSDFFFLPDDIRACPFRSVLLPLFTFREYCSTRFSTANLQCLMDDHLTSLLRVLSSVFGLLFCAYLFSFLSLSHLAKKDANNRPQRERDRTALIYSSR